MRELPLFPLNVVLFPGMALPLHVFEERYKEMMRLCLAGDRTFGVVLIKEGPEVGGPAVSHEVGTTARVEALQELPEGRLNLVAVGVERFRIVELARQEPYLVGRVELLEEQASAPAPELVARVRELFGGYMEMRRKLEAVEVEELASEPVAFSYQVARALRASPPLLRQSLLELEAVADRLERELPLLRREIDLLRLLSTAPRGADSQGSFSKN